MNNIAIHRKQAADAVIEKYINQELKLGKLDCVNMAQTVCDALNIKTVLTDVETNYKTELGAAKFLKKQGFENLADAVDACGFERIAPAYAMPSDILAVENEAIGGYSLMVAISNGQAIGFVEVNGKIIANTCNILEACILNHNTGRKIIAWKVVA